MVIFLSFVNTFTFEQVETGCIKFYKVVEGIITKQCFSFNKMLLF